MSKAATFCGCGWEIIKGSQFCTSCGKKLETINTKLESNLEMLKGEKSCECGEEIIKGAKFCASCGATGSELQVEEIAIECICGAGIEPGTLMCMECGRRVTSPL